MHDKAVLLAVGVFCALTCLQVARTDLAGDYEIDYDEDEGFWIGHGLGNRKEGDEILKVLHKSVGPFVEPQNVTVVEKFSAADGESITFTQFNSSKVLTYFHEVVLDFNPKNFYIRLKLFNITSLRLQRTVYGFRSNAIKPDVS
uniref:Putative secreted protein n=1 Tax=Anopheles triannulatus TaxID=58253 RepID=A0A2M4AYD5_9DIPT